MKLEIGKTYNFRSGKTIKIIKKTPESYHPDRVYYCGADYQYFWYEDGKFYINPGNSEHDIISEYVPKSKPHIHSELIKAWADGAEIELLSNSGVWSPTNTPLWNLKNTYRVRPERKPNNVQYHCIYGSKNNISCGHQNKYFKDYAGVYAILRVEIDYNDEVNPVLVSATLEKS